MKTIGVFFGGQSPEHEISILTGIQAFHAFDKNKYNPIPIYVTREGLFYTGENISEPTAYKNIELLLEKSNLLQIEKVVGGTFIVSKKLFGSQRIKVDVAFLAFHGGGGEGGGFQGFCETLDLPYTGSNILGSSLSMDKVAMKKVLTEAGIPVSAYVVAQEDSFKADQILCMTAIEQQLSYPLFVKPANGGSSIGVSRAANRKELENALELALSFDSKVLIEKEFEHDSEINISCLGSWDKSIILSVPEEVYSDTEFLDFENKYLKGGKSKKGPGPKSIGMVSTNRHIPAHINPELKKQIEEHARTAFSALNCSGVARLDFLVNKKTNTVVLVEANTIPGSLAYYLWEASGKPFSELIDDMVNLAIERFNEKTRHARKFTSTIFKNL